VLDFKFKHHVMMTIHKHDMALQQMVLLASLRALFGLMTGGATYETCAFPVATSPA
jgi:hypothetical protein